MADFSLNLNENSSNGGKKEDFNALLDELIKIFGNLSPQIALAMRATFPRIIANEFKKSVDPFGTPWPPIPVPAPWRKNPTDRDKPLWDTGHLFGSLVAADAIQTRGPNSVFFGTNVEYAPKHEFGQGVKQRRFMPVSDKNFDSLFKEFNNIVIYSIENGELPNVPAYPVNTTPPGGGSSAKKGKKSSKNAQKRAGRRGKSKL